MTVVPALVPPVRAGVLHTAPLRLAVFDCSVLTSEVIGATRRWPPYSSFVEAMMAGTLRGFMTRQVWAEVPRVLEDRWRESDGSFDLDTALCIWWRVYVPLLYTVDTDRLPATPASERLAAEDPSDVGMLVLHAVLGPAALIACDGDLRRSGLPPENWTQVRAALGQVTDAEEQADVANRVALLAVEGTARAVVRTTAVAWKHPVVALMVGAVLVGGVLAYRRSHPVPTDKVTPFLNQVCEAIMKHVGEVNQRFDVGETIWADAERGSIGEALLHRVARVLACSPEPMLRSEILEAVPEFPGRTWRDRMFSLYCLLHTYPMFCEVQRHRWQVGRVNVGAWLV